MLGEGEEASEVEFSPLEGIALFDDPMQDDWGDTGYLSQGSGSISYVAEPGIDAETARTAFAKRRDDVAASIAQHMQEVSGNGSDYNNLASNNLFFRSRYQSTNVVFDQMNKAIDAVENDEVLSNLADVTESLAFNKMSIEYNDDADISDILNQWAAHVDLDSRLREIWRELFKVSQCYIGIHWAEMAFVPRNRIAEEMGKNSRKRRKVISLVVPESFTLMDPTKILPVGGLMFDNQKYAYLASEAEHEAFLKVFNGEVEDPYALEMFVGRYSPNGEEAALAKGYEKRMWLFKKHALIRHTLTKAQYERFCPVRMKSTFPLLDLKSHLRNADRSVLIGATNFIVVIKRGSDRWPAKPVEIAQLKEESRVIARMPVIVGDHRLSVEIVTPNSDNTLKRDRYDALDERILMSAMGTFRAGATASSGSGEGVLWDMKVVARGIESRRHEIARTLEAEVFGVIVQANETLTERPKMIFNPRRVAVGLDSGILNAILAIRDRGDLSRQTTLEELDYSQDTEYYRRKQERKYYDDEFKSQVPFSTPATETFNPKQEKEGGEEKDGNAGTREE
jgi:hypothetical protein